ncbi:hypothetical protein Pan14r_07910 [Crateriforma conspicua]|uniref:Uncharacterized protein n=1 Tax=Crateriforma conspicua TaxID=2527996 RepID=A0A5C5Y2Q4_9PLAN|nr:hypothetical protein Mal65_18200 [Crateriforma conspicua]TWT68545.1 hypothetical protein Pan14r_07910 [Crateriforma conspicua]
MPLGCVVRTMVSGVVNCRPTREKFGTLLKKKAQDSREFRRIDSFGNVDNH